MLVDVLKIGEMSAAVAVTSVTATKSMITLPLRNFLHHLAEKHGGFFEWIEELMSCPYCFSHWAALLAVLGARPAGNWLPNTLTLVAFSSAWVWLIRVAHSPRKEESD